MSHKQQQTPQLKKFRWLMFIIITILCFLLLLLTYRTNIFLFWTQYHQPAIIQPKITVHTAVPQPSGPVQKDSQEKKVPFVAVNRTKTLLIAAYQEHRTGRKEVSEESWAVLLPGRLTGCNMVRVIALVLRSETVAYHCLLLCSQWHISEGVRSIHSDHFGFAYGTADIMCPVPSGCEAPSHIALTSAAVNSEDIHVSELLEVKNQKARSDSFPYNFTVCFSTMYNYTNVLQANVVMPFVQSLEMLQLLGVNRVVIYKTSSSPEIQNILDYYTHKGLVQVIPWSLSGLINVSQRWLPEHGPGDLHYFGQIPALNDCLYRYMYESRYVALHDTDELILPQSVYSWSELLPELEKKYGSYQCYMFENNVFPSTVGLSPQSHEHLHWQNVPGVNILAHLQHLPAVPYTNFKIIVNPRAIFAVTVHGVLNPQSSCIWVDRNIARMYHTRASEVTEPGKLLNDKRLLDYGPRLIQAVNTVLTENGLLLKNSIE